MARHPNGRFVGLLCVICKALGRVLQSKEVGDARRIKLEQRSPRLHAAEPKTAAHGYTQETLSSTRYPPVCAYRTP